MNPLCVPATPVYDKNLAGLGDIVTGAAPPAVVTKGALIRTVPLATRVGTVTWACSQLIDGGSPASIGSRHQNSKFTMLVCNVFGKVLAVDIDRENL